MPRQSRKQSQQSQGSNPSPNGQRRRSEPKGPPHGRDGVARAISEERERDQGDGDGPELVLRPGVLSTGRRIHWLWQGRLMFGSVAILQGEKGSGKSSWLRAIAAHVTGGPRLHGEKGGPRRAGRVLWFAGEEDLDSRVIPGCHAAGCVLSEMRFADDQGDEQHTLCLPRDAERLKRLIRREGAVMVAVDPLLGFVSQTAEIESGSIPARAFMRTCRSIAKDTGSLFLVTRNLTKSTNDGALAAGRGSGELGNAARSVLHTHTLPQTPGHYGLAVVAGNDGAPVPTLTYRIDDVDGCGVVRVDGVSSLTADELVRGDEGDVDRSLLEYAKALIRAALPSGELSVAVLRAKAEMAGIKIRTLQLAKQRLGVGDRREGRREDTQVYWIAPKGGYPE